MISDMNFDLYLTFIELKKESLSLDLESLKNLTFGHVSHIALSKSNNL